MSASNPIPTGTVFSLVIPWAETWHTEEMILAKFEELEWGVVSKVSIVSRTGHGKRCHTKVFIHFSAWKDTQGVKKHLTSDGGKGELKIWHSETHFWKVRASTWKFKETEISGGKPKVEFC